MLPCARYMNALDAGITQFSENLKFKEILRTPEQLKKTVQDPNRKSNGKGWLRVHCPLQVSCFSQEIRHAPQLHFRNSLSTEMVDKHRYIVSHGFKHKMA